MSVRILFTIIFLGVQTLILGLYVLVTGHIPDWSELITILTIIVVISIVVGILLANPVIKFSKRVNEFYRKNRFEVLKSISKNEFVNSTNILELFMSNWEELQDLVGTEDVFSKIEELELSRERRIALFENASYPILVANDNKEIVDVNKEFMNLSAYDESKLEASKITFVLPDDNIITEIYEIAVSKNFWEGETDLLTANGEFIPVGLKVTKISAGEIDMMQFLVADLREVKQKEKALERQAKEVNKFNEVTVQRETKMVELKKEIERLSKIIKSIRG